MTSEEIRPRRNAKAIASLVFGVLSFVPLVSIGAIALGHMALSNIRRFSGKLGGRRLAVAGLVLGYLGILWTAVICFVLVYFRLHPEPIENAWPYAPAGLRTIDSAAEMYSSTYSNGYPPTLAALGPNIETLPDGFDVQGASSCDHAGLIDGVLASRIKGSYKFTYVPQTSNGSEPALSTAAKKHGCTVPGVLAFTVTAEPVSPSAQSPSFFTDQTGVVRMNKNGPATASSPPIE